MKLIAPEYYKEFHCIANKCNESCCSAGWEIDIDEKTAKLYSEVNGEFGEKLRKNIEYDEGPHFILNKNGSCPFLNEQKLCKIYIKLGENSLCHICKEHPRFYEWFNNIKECGIGLCCEEAARIILSYNQPFSTYETEIPYESANEYDNKLYSFLYKAREKIILHLENTSIPFNNRVRDIIWYSGNLQQKIYDENYTDSNPKSQLQPLKNVNSNIETSKENLKPILNFLLTLESCNSNWIPYLKNCINNYSDYTKNISDFEISNPKIFKYLQNIAIYFVWRYFLKATFDEDILSKVGLMAVSIAVLKYLFFCEWQKNGTLSFETCVKITKRYSEEIEYSDENLRALAEACYELQDFSIKKLIEVF